MIAHGREVTNKISNQQLLLYRRFPFWAFNHSTQIFRTSVGLIVLDFTYNASAVTGYLSCYKQSVFLSFTQMVWALPDDLVSFEDPDALNWVS
jgi:hypothetical protein